MIRIPIATFLICCLANVLTAQDAADDIRIQEILERYTESYGGLRDANRLASISIEGTQIQGEHEFDFQIWKKRPNSMRYHLEKGDTRLTSIFNGNEGWLLTSKGGESSVVELSGMDLESLRKEARFESPLYRHLEKPENRITLIGREQIGSIQTYALRVEEPGSAANIHYLDPESSLVLRIDHLNEADEVAYQTIYRYYREVDGYPFAHEIENRINGETVSLTRVDSVLVNPGLLSIYFQNPSK